MGNQQPGRTRSDTYTRYERDGEDGRYVTLEQPDSSGINHPSLIDERVRSPIVRINLPFICRSLQDMIQVFPYVYVINVKCIIIIVNKQFILNYKLRRKPFPLSFVILLHPKIKKFISREHLLIGKRRF